MTGASHPFPAVSSSWVCLCEHRRRLVDACVEDQYLVDVISGSVHITFSRVRDTNTEGLEAYRSELSRKRPALGAPIAFFRALERQDASCTYRVMNLLQQRLR